MTDSQDLRSALIESFPARSIERTDLEAPSERWGNYDEAEAWRADVLGKSWPELTAAVLERHHGALRYAGNATFALLLPAYLLYLVEHRAFNEVPFTVAGELKRYGDRVNLRIFDDRVAQLTADQRSVIRDVVSSLTSREPMEAVMTAAFESYWKHLPS